MPRRKSNRAMLWWVWRVRGVGPWEEVTFDLKELATSKSIPERRNSKFKAPEAGTAGRFEEQKGNCGWREW